VKINRFVCVGENIHCTRVYKVDGKFVNKNDQGEYAISYLSQDGEKTLPIPSEFIGNADWDAGKTKHCASAIWQGNYGTDDNKALGLDYLQSLARRQEQAGATYLDINVDEFSTDIAQREELMKWTVGVLQEVTSIPMSIDSSNIDILRAGLENCDTSRGAPLMNSVSLERPDALQVATEFNATVIASAAGAADLPTTTEGRMKNVSEIVARLTDAGMALSDIHVDPLVFPIATDQANGQGYLDACRAVRSEYGEDIHIVGGLSNISFGMPNRKLIGQVFSYLAVEAGADGGIVDPFQVNADILESLDTESEAFKLASDLLLGKDDFGMNFITASREGKV
jgi:5-methyltetrahydrofolate--homocysteine methyltransferase